jgi:hypothetical protein
MNYEQFKTFYAKDIAQLQMTEDEVAAVFQIYQEDPEQFTVDMLDCLL